jgi:hypothetical protein
MRWQVASDWPAHVAFAGRDHRLPRPQPLVPAPFGLEPVHGRERAGHDAIDEEVGAPVGQPREDPVRDDQVLDRDHGDVTRASGQDRRRDRRHLLGGRGHGIVLAVDVVEDDQVGALLVDLEPA